MYQIQLYLTTLTSVKTTKSLEQVKSEMQNPTEPLTSAIVAAQASIVGVIEIESDSEQQNIDMGVAKTEGDPPKHTDGQHTSHAAMDVSSDDGEEAPLLSLVKVTTAVMPPANPNAGTVGLGEPAQTEQPEPDGSNSSSTSDDSDSDVDAEMADPDQGPGKDDAAALAPAPKAKTAPKRGATRKAGAKPKSKPKASPKPARKPKHTATKAAAKPKAKGSTPKEKAAELVAELTKSGKSRRSKKTTNNKD